MELTKLAEAKEYRMSQSIRAAKEKQILNESETVGSKELDKFPVTLN